MDFFSLLAASDLPRWITESFPIIKGILVGYIALASIAIIILVLVQPSNSHGGLSAITGQTTETYYSHNKGATREGRLKKITAWIALSIAIVAVVFFILSLIVE